MWLSKQTVEQRLRASESNKKNTSDVSAIEELTDKDLADVSGGRCTGSISASGGRGRGIRIGGGISCTF